MLEGVEHRLCLRHLYANFKKKFGGGVLIRDLMMGAAKATYFEAWKEKMEEIKNVDAKAHDWLIAIPTRQWCKHAFTYYPKCDVLMNNISEAFNSTILVARDKPIITMCEWIRSYLMGRVAKQREKLSKFQGRIMPKPRRRLDWEVEHSGNWIPTYAGKDKFEVTHTLFVKKFVVNLELKRCSCNFWELVGIPCRHAVAAISYRARNDLEEFVHHYYSRDTYEQVYNHTVSPINGQDMWPTVAGAVELQPPQFKRGPGRPKKLRTREVDEDQNRTKLKRANTSYRCTRCDKLGHNSRSCKSPVVNPNAQARKV